MATGFPVEHGFRGYPVCWVTNNGRHGVGKLGTGARRNGKEVHVDLSGGVVSMWDLDTIRRILKWVFDHHGHITRMDLALDDRLASVSVETVRQAFEAGQAVTRSQKFQSIKTVSNKDGGSRGETLYFGSRQSQTMLRVYDKRLEMQHRKDERAHEYGVRWELEFKEDRAQACAKALVNLPIEDWREFVVGVLRSYVDFRETTREAKPYEKYRAPLLAWWETKGLRNVAWWWRRSAKAWRISVSGWATRSVRRWRWRTASAATPGSMTDLCWEPKMAAQTL